MLTFIGRSPNRIALLLAACIAVALIGNAPAVITESKVTRLTREPESDSQGSWSPDGKRIVFVSGRGGGKSLWVINADGTQPELLAPSSGEGEFFDGPNWSCDARKLVYSSNRGGSVTPKIWSYDFTARTHTRLTSNGSIDWMPCCSPDGRFVAFVSDRTGQDSIWIMRAHGKEQRRLVENAWHPVWSPDGDWIAYESLVPGREGLAIIRTDGSESKVVLPGAAEASWSPDGRRLVTVVRKEARRELWLVSRDGSNARALPMAGTGVSSPAWSPLGTAVVFDQDVNGNRDLYALELIRRVPDVQLTVPDLKELNEGGSAVLRIAGGASVGAKKLLVEFGAGVEPRAWTPIRAFSENLAGGGMQLVADWDTKGLGGYHTLRLTATDPEGDTATALAKVRLPSEFGVTYSKLETPPIMVADHLYEVPMTIENTGAMTWLENGRYAVSISYRWTGPAGDIVVKQGLRTRLMRPVVLGDKFETVARVQAPKRPGNYVLEWDLLHGDSLWFSEKNTMTAKVPVEVVVPLNAEFLAHGTPERMTPGQQYSIELSIKNLGASTWTVEGETRIAVAYRWYSEDGALMDDRPLLTPLPNPVQPGAISRFIARVQAPTAPGRYVLRWDLLTGTTWFAELGSRYLDVSVRVQPLYAFQFVDHATPTSMVPGETYVVALRLKNTGSVRWALNAETPMRVGYRWKDAEGRVYAAPPLYAELPAAVDAGQIVGVSARVQAPPVAGSYVLEWDVAQGESGWLSDQGSKPVSAGVIVARQQYSPRYVAERHPTAMNVGQAYTIRLTLRNQGLLTWSPTGRHPVKLGYRWLDSLGREVRMETLAAILPEPVPLGGAIAVTARAVAPAKPGTYTLQWDLIHEGQTWFSERGATTLNVPVLVEALYAAVFRTHDTPMTMVKGQTYTAQLRVHNGGSLLWPARSGVRVQLSYRWYNDKDALIVSKGLVTDLPHDVEKGDDVDIVAQIQAPEVAGNYTLRWDLNHGGLIWFADKGLTPLELKVIVK